MGIFTQLGVCLLAGAGALGLSAPTTAASDTVYIGMVKTVGQPWCPEGWAPLDGGLHPINTNSTLYHLLGTLYGGNGITTFATPDLRGRAIVGSGQGSNLPRYEVGQRGGNAAYRVPAASMPPHAHSLFASVHDPSLPTPHNAAIPAMSNNTSRLVYAEPSSSLALMSSNVIGEAGFSAPVAEETRPPYQVLTFCMSFIGVFPPRTRENAP